MPRYKIILNPTAGKGRAAGMVPRIHEELTRLHLDYDLVQTNAVGHARTLAAEAVEQGWDTIVAAGGDGTANEVLNGILQTQNSNVAMGILPVGRGNDFAFSVGAPGDLKAACAALAGRHLKRIDIGRASSVLFPDGVFFGNGIGIGFDAEVGFAAARTRLNGMFAYLYGVIETLLLHFKAPVVEVNFDGQTITRPALLISIMNGRRLGGGFMIAPQGDPSDGLFDLSITDAVSRLKALQTVPKIMKGAHLNDPIFTITRARTIHIIARQGHLASHMDGETISVDGDWIKVEMIPARLDVIVSPQVRHSSQTGIQ